MSGHDGNTGSEEKPSSHRLERIDCVDTVDDRAENDNDQGKVSFKLVMHALVRKTLQFQLRTVC